MSFWKELNQEFLITVAFKFIVVVEWNIVQILLLKFNFRLIYMDLY